MASLLNIGQKSLTDLVRGIRSNKKNESQYISQALQEIKEELRSNDTQKKSVAVQKLTYLQMLGYDMSWAAFNIIEVMSQQKFTPKRIGYLAASQSFDEKTEVITLVTQLIRRDMTSSSVWEAGVALNCLANICTPDLARDLAADVVSLLSSSRPYIRKKACLVLYKVFLKFPDALRPSFPRLKEKLEDPDPAVVSAAVNVICELARKNPKNYISLAPTLFNILTTSTNNWVLIKLIKLFGTLLPIEPRLAKKLVQPLTNLINNTPAVSTLYECIQTCTTGLADHLPTIKLCITKLRNFVEDPDQNLKYLGLISLANIMKIHPKAVAEHRDLIVNCLDDEDTTIRLRALDLLEGMVTKKNIVDIVRKLLSHIEKADQQSYKDAIVEKIISICSKNSYGHITDFEWYISVLLELAHVNGTQHGELIASQLMDVVIRVEVIRPFAVQRMHYYSLDMAALLRDASKLSENPQKGGNCEVLYSAAWITGEFARHVTDSQSVIESLLQPRVASLPAHIQSVFMQSVLKLFASVITEGGGHSQGLVDTEETSTPAVISNAAVDEIVKVMQTRLPLFSQSQHLEVQERACFVQEILKLYNELKVTGVDLASEIASLFNEPLNPVAPKAQKKVPVPEELNLDEWINEPEPEPERDEDFGKNWELPSAPKFGDDSDDEEKTPAEIEEKKAKQDSKPKRSGPYYLSPDTSKASSPTDNIPIATLTKDDLGLKDDKLSSYKDNIKKYKPKKNAPQVTVLKDEDLPPGATKSDDEEESKTNEPNPFANINFNEPLRPEEQLPIRTHRLPTQAAKSDDKSKKTKKHRTEGKEKKKKSKKGEKQEKEESLIDFEPKPEHVGFEEVGSPVEAPKEKKKKKKKEGSSSSGGKTKKESKDKEKPKEKVKKTKKESTPPSQSGGPKLRVNPKQSKQIMAAFAFKNLASEAISNIEFSVPSTLNIKVADRSSVKPSFVLQPGEKNNHNIIFDIQSVQQPQKVTGSMSYTVGTTASNKKDFQLNMPVSAFIIPIKVSKEEFINILTEGGPYVLSSTQVHVKAEEDFRTFVVALATLLHVELITLEAAASFYGRSIQGHNVAIYVKQLPNNMVSVDLKSNDGQIVNALTAEVTNYFH